MAVVFNSRKEVIEEVISSLDDLKENTDFDSMPFETFSALYLELSNAESIMKKGALHVKTNSK